MMRLLKIEFLKIRHYSVLRAFVLLFVVLLPFSFYAISMIEIPFFPSKLQLFGFPGIWAYLSYLASYFNIFPALLIIVLACNEVTYKTEKQNVIDGLSRKEVVLAKFYVVITLTLFVALFVLLTSLVFGAIYSHVPHFFWGIEKFFFFVLQTFGYLTLALVLAILLRRTSLAVLAFLVIFFLLGLILEGTLGDVAIWTPVNILNGLTPQPFFNTSMANAGQRLTETFELSQGLRSIIALVYTVIFFILGYVVMKRRDL